MAHDFEIEQWLPFPRDLVFAFFADPKNLPPLMPQWQKPRIEEVTFCPPPPRPAGTPRFPGVAAGDGTKLVITARALPFIPLRGGWHALIQDFRWNEGFCDVQLHGPFAYWKHCHSVRDAASPQDGGPGTIVHDHVTYALRAEPFTQLGLPAVQAAMRALFQYRQARVAEWLPQFAEATRVTSRAS